MDRVTFQKMHGIIGESVEMKEIVEIIQQVAPTDLTVLITGESGSGKEVIARAIYKASKRANKNMISVNCGAIPEGILESELFGHEKGAFTGAVEARKGYFELADEGTIFLDEIGDLIPGTQVKFLRVLENGEFMRVGSSKTMIVNVRVIAATNRNLEDEVQTKKFRSDLFYRLRSINIKIPPLRDRKEDIPLFFDKFVEETCRRNNIVFKGLSNEAITQLMNYNWPGNVRELKNVVESLVVLEKNRIIEAKDVLKYIHSPSIIDTDRNLPIHLNRSAEQSERELILRALFELKSNMIEIKELLLSFLQTKSLPAPTDLYYNSDNLSLKESEKQSILNALKVSQFNRRKTAKKLGISARTLYRKMKEYKIDPNVV